MFSSIQSRLRRLIEHRNFFFKDTTEEEAYRYLASKSAFKGLTEDEIQGYEQALRQQFPADFRQYLLYFGKQCGELFANGQDLNHREFLEYNDDAQELLDDCNIKGFLNDQTLVFEFHQLYTFSCFRHNAEGERVIFQFSEGDEAPVERYKSFADMLEYEVQKAEAWHKEESTTRGYFVIIKDGYIRQHRPSINSGVIPRDIGDHFI